MMRASLPPYLAVGLVAPAFSVVYALWFDGVVVDEAMVVWMVPVILLAVVGVARMQKNRLEPDRSRAVFWGAVVAQVTGVVSGAVSASSFGFGAPLWAVAATSLLVLAGWALLAVRASRAQSTRP
jgi:cytochrome b subunit of formate dehydrogenase